MLWEWSCLRITAGRIELSAVSNKVLNDNFKKKYFKYYIFILPCRGIPVEALNIMWCFNVEMWESLLSFWLSVLCRSLPQSSTFTEDCKLRGMCAFRLLPESSGTQKSPFSLTGGMIYCLVWPVSALEKRGAHCWLNTINVEGWMLFTL